MKREIACGVFLAILAWEAPARADEPADVPPPEPSSITSDPRPGVLVDAAALPDRFRGVVSATGGTVPDAGAASYAAGGNVLFAFARRFAVRAGFLTTPTTEGTRLTTPSIGGYVQLAEQASAGVDVTAGFRYRVVGPEGVGGQAAGRMLLGRDVGLARLSVDGSIGRGVGARGDLDFEAGAAIALRCTRALRLGAEARTRGEIVDEYETIEDEGRPVELVSGAVVGLDLERVLLQALGGVSWPRGPYPVGPAALASLAFSF